MAKNENKYGPPYLNFDLNRGWPFKYFALIYNPWEKHHLFHLNMDLNGQYPFKFSSFFQTRYENAFFFTRDLHMDYKWPAPGLKLDLNGDGCI